MKTLKSHTKNKNNDQHEVKNDILKKKKKMSGCDVFDHTNDCERNIHRKDDAFRCWRFNKLASIMTINIKTPRTKT